MHAEYWGLRESPFRAWLDPRFYHESATHDEALSRLKFLIEHRRRLGLLLGGRGSGKSLTLAVLGRDLRRQACAVALVNLLGLDTRELLWSLATELGAHPREDAPLFSLWRMLGDFLSEQRLLGAPTVLLLDDADHVAPEVLTNLVRLLALDSSPDARLTMILAAGRTSASRLGSRLLELSELRIELERWEETDTVAYLTESLDKAGRQTPVFEPRAAARLHELTRGVPRQVRQLAELALVAGAGEELVTIDEPTIDAVYQELSVTPSAVQEMAFAGE